MFEGAEKLRKMRETVKKELEHIPRGTFDQNMLRSLYQAARMNSLGKTAQVANDKDAVLAVSVAYMRRDNPKFEPKYDPNFFKEIKLK